MRRELEVIRKLFIRLIRAKPRRFPLARERMPAPTSHGVYLIFGPRGRILHVGRTVRGKKGLRQRLNNHLLGQSSFTASHFRRKGAKLRGTYSFSYIEVIDARTRALLEAYAVAHLCPKHLGVGKNVS